MAVTQFVDAARLRACNPHYLNYSNTPTRLEEEAASLGYAAWSITVPVPR